MVASSVKKHAPFKLGMGKKLFRVTALPSLPVRHFQKFSGRFRFNDRLPDAHFTESHVISFTYAGSGRIYDSTSPYPMPCSLLFACMDWNNPIINLSVPRNVSSPCEGGFTANSTRSAVTTFHAEGGVSIRCNDLYKMLLRSTRDKLSASHMTVLVGVFSIFITLIPPVIDNPFCVRWCKKNIFRYRS